MSSAQFFFRCCDYDDTDVAKVVMDSVRCTVFVPCQLLCLDHSVSDKESFVVIPWLQILVWIVPFGLILGLMFE